MFGNSHARQKEIQNLQMMKDRHKLASERRKKAVAEDIRKDRFAEHKRLQHATFTHVTPYSEEQYAADQQHESIFVSLASYRDPECVRTLEDLFKKAAYPGRIFVGVCQQNNEMEDIDCMKSETAHRFERNIRVMRLTAGEAKGPMYARHLIEAHLFQDEMFFMQIDSHTVCVPHWDIKAIDQLLQCESDNPVLTSYPMDYDIKTRKLPSESTEIPFLAFNGYNERTGFTQQSREKCKIRPPKPLRSLFWAAGFSFSLGECIRQVPYDPHTDYLFLGEEMSMSLRLYTHGWDVFTPAVNLVFHYIDRGYRPVFWEQVYQKYDLVDEQTRLQRKAQESNAVKRMYGFVSGHTDLPKPYGLGQVRTYEEWCQFTGLNVLKRTYERRTRYGLTPDSTEEEQRIRWGKILFPRTAEAIEPHVNKNNHNNNNTFQKNIPKNSQHAKGLNNKITTIHRKKNTTQTRESLFR